MTPFALTLSIIVSISASFQAEAWLSPAKSSENVQSTRLFSAVNNNIVLKPSDDQLAFDSFRIGSARVHRYSRSDDPDSEIEYVMWYHGRSKEMESEALPPLSTGRIGRATSKNGLVWEKEKVGSESEDAPGVTLGLNKESWWGFDTLHVGLGNVLMPMSTPAVLAEGGVYLKYFFGGSAEETLLADYIDQNVPDSMKDAKIAGMKMKIGVAVSQDGVSFGRVEGDDPSGAVIAPYDKNDPNQRDAPAVVEEELYCAWPEVVVDLKGNEKSEMFRMYYSTMLKETKEKCIAFAVSQDGFRWFKRGVSIRPDKDTLDAAGCARCCVIRDAVFDTENGSWIEIDSWKMYYEGVSPEDNKHRIMLAESNDGKSWMKKGIALDVGEENAWDNNGVGSPHLIRMDDGSLRMYYTGQGEDGSTAIGVAKLMRDGEKAGHFVREQATITFV